jgi:hypothetical protein
MLFFQVAAQSRHAQHGILHPVHQRWEIKQEHATRTDYANNKDQSLKQDHALYKQRAHGIVLHGIQIHVLLDKHRLGTVHSSAIAQQHLPHQTSQEHARHHRKYAAMEK